MPIFVTMYDQPNETGLYFMLFPLHLTSKYLQIKIFVTLEITNFRFSSNEKEQTMQYLILWRNKEGKTASVEQLIAILKKFDPPQNLLADELQKFTTSELFNICN